jgi:hypothetical protein
VYFGLSVLRFACARRKTRGASPEAAALSSSLPNAIRMTGRTDIGFDEAAIYWASLCHIMLRDEAQP